MYICYTLSKLLFLSKQCSIHHKQTLIINEIEAASECSNMAILEIFFMVIFRLLDHIEEDMQGRIVAD
jgi:hypothetical protein